MNFKRLAGLTILVLVMTMGVAFAEGNQTDRFDELQLQIDNASTGDTLTVDGYYNYTNYKKVGDDIASPIEVDKSISFKGKNNAVFDLSNQHLNVNCEAVKFRDITFTNFKYVKASSYASYINCTFISQNGQLSTAENTNIKDSTFKNTRLKLTSYAQVDNCIFRDCKATAVELSNADTADIENCLFESNKLALSISNFDGVNVKSCVFNKNERALSYSAGHSASAKKSVFSRCSFLNNGNKNVASAISCDCGVKKNNKYTGAFDVLGFKRCTFIGNVAKTAAIVFKASQKSYIRNSIFDSNNAKYIVWGNPNLNDNFWGFNMNSIKELECRNLIGFKKSGYYDMLDYPTDWVNLNIRKVDATHAILKFSNDKIPAYNVKINNKKTAVGKAFECRNLKVSMYNNGGKLINRLVLNGKVSISQKVYYHQDKVTVVVKDSNSKRLANANVIIKLSNGASVKLKTNSKGIAKHSLKLKPGVYIVHVYAYKDNYALKLLRWGPHKVLASKSKIIAHNIKVKYHCKKTLKIKVKNTKNHRPIPFIKIKIKLKITSKKTKCYFKKTNSKGIVHLKVPKLKAGKHRAWISSMNKFAKTSKVKKIIIKVYKVKKARHKTISPSSFFG